MSDNQLPIPIPPLIPIPSGPVKSAIPAKPSWKPNWVGIVFFALVLVLGVGYLFSEAEIPTWNGKPFSELTASDKKDGWRVVPGKEVVYDPGLSPSMQDYYVKKAQENTQNRRIFGFLMTLVSGLYLTVQGRKMFKS